MRIMTEAMFKKVKNVKLNKNGKVIGSIVLYKGKYYYYSKRISIHFFIKFEGLGLDKTLLRKMTIPSEKKEDILFQKINGIIIFYDGDKEKRFYMVDPYEWLDGIPYGTAKEFEGEIQSYGEQKIFPIKRMTLLGLHPKDYEVKK